MDDYDYGSWDYGGDMPGSEGSGLMYGSDMDPSSYAEPSYGGDVGAFGNVDQPMDWSQFNQSSAPFNPEEYLAQQGGYSAPGEQGIFDKMGSTFMDKFRSNPMGVLSTLGTFGTSLYSAIEGNKQRNALAKQIQDAKEAREARLAKYGAVLPLKLQRTMLQPQGDLLTAGQRSGGLNWFTPAQYVPMAEGGVVEPGWLQRIKEALASRQPAPAVVGAGTAAQAGDTMLRSQYQRYAVGQQMEGAEPLPYEIWAQMRQQGRGMAKGGLSGLDGGQDDVIDVRAAPGEYVFDADSVAALGDGNNANGAAKLDQMRMNLRKHKRSAPADKIPPKAKKPEAYMKKGK